MAINLTSVTGSYKSTFLCLCFTWYFCNLLAVIPFKEWPKATQVILKKILSNKPVEFTEQ